MEKITTKQIMESIKRNKWLILVPALVLGLGIFGTKVLNSDSYEAQSVLMVTSNDDEPISYNKLILNEKLANIYAQFLESEDLYERVSEKLDTNLESDDIEDKLEYEVNPQGGVISFSYKDRNENRARDSLTLITEEFRDYAKNYLNMENIEYLQNVVVKESSKTRGIVFSIIGLIVGALVGLLILLIKEIFSDKIEEADDIRQLGLEVLGDFSYDNKSEPGKIRRKIINTSNKAVIGLSSINDKSYEANITKKLAESIEAPVVSSKGLDYRQVKKQILNYDVDKDYILVDEESLENSEAYDLAGLEDYKIIVAKKSTHKKDLIKQVRELERLGIKVLGVIYYN